MNVISESGDYERVINSTSINEITFLSKNNKVDEIAVVGFNSQEKSVKTDDEVFVVVEEMPEFPGGNLEMRKFLAQNVKYPVEAQKKGIQGKVYVTFVVNKDGSVSNAKISRSVDPILDAEAVRVVSILPKWKPGRQRGQDVAVLFTVPINFALSSTDFKLP